MAEIAISTIIRIIIVILVIVVVGLGVFMLWNNSLKPYFSELGRTETAGISAGVFILLYSRRKA